MLFTKSAGSGIRIGIGKEARSMNSLHRCFPYMRIRRCVSVVILIVVVASILIRSIANFRHSNIEVERRFWKSWMKHSPPYNADKLGIVPGSRGVVLTSASASVAKAIAAVLLLRETGCTLPVQFSYLSSQVTDVDLDVLRSFNISTREFSDHIKGNNWNREEFRLGAAKVDSILASPFEEVLFLDPDNFVLQDPTYLFETNIFKRYGALFWPDYKVRKNETELEEIYQIFDHTSRRPALEFESGQIVLNKRMVWPALQLAKCISFRARYYFGHFLGDKEAFFWGFTGATVPFYLNPHYLQSVGMVLEEESVFNVDDSSKPGRVFCGLSMLQMDFKDATEDSNDSDLEEYTPRPLFMHGNNIKYIYKKDVDYFQSAMTYVVPLEDRKRGKNFADYRVDFRASEDDKKFPQFKNCIQMDNAKGLKIRMWDWSSQNPGNWSKKFHDAMAMGHNTLIDAYVDKIRDEESGGPAYLDSIRDMVFGGPAFINDTIRDKVFSGSLDNNINAKAALEHKTDIYVQALLDKKY